MGTISGLSNPRDLDLEGESGISAGFSDAARTLCEQCQRRAQRTGEGSEAGAVGVRNDESCWDHAVGF